jgi:hypothetical protein
MVQVWMKSRRGVKRNIMSMMLRRKNVFRNESLITLWWVLLLAALARTLFQSG